MSSHIHSTKTKKGQSIVFKPASLAQYFLVETKLKKMEKVTPLDVEKWPAEWKKISFKSYPRFKQITLPKKFTDKGMSLKAVLKKRKSERKFKKKSLPLNEISELLYFSSGIVRKKSKDWNKSRRPYPSAGARYPLEVYLVTNKVSGLKSALYHYNVKNHGLELLLEGKFVKRLARFTGQDWVEKSLAIFFISAVFRRTENKYQSRGLRYVFMEAGHLGQNIYLLAASLGLSCCSIGGYADEKIDKLLDLNGLDESVAYIVCVG